MNMTALPPLDVMLMIGRAVFLIFSFVIASVTFTAWRRATRRQTEEVLAQSQTLLERLNALEARFGERLDSTAAVVARIDERSERQSHLSNGPPADYQVAIRLARGGASREELVSRCGLSVGEADLVRRLHRSANAVA